VYFCCREALQNVAKHAESATGASIDVSSQGGMLTFAVADDGAGFELARTDRGSGLINMRDRLTVVGGELDVRSRPGTGTVVSGAIPLG
jgi:signal transduction histidine kinase